VDDIGVMVLGLGLWLGMAIAAVGYSGQESGDTWICLHDEYMVPFHFAEFQFLNRKPNHNPNPV